MQLSSEHLLKAETLGSVDKPAVVFLHGFLGSGKDWREIAEPLANDYFCVLVDLPGHGTSHSVNTSFYDFPQQLIQLLDQLKVKQFGLLGYSLGGRLALAAVDFLQQQGAVDRLTGLLLESANPGLTDSQQKVQRIAHDKKWAKKITDQSFNEFLSEWYLQPVFADLPRQIRQLVQSKRSDNQHPKALAQALTGFSLGLQPDYSALFTQLCCPVIYLHGARDQKFSTLAQKLAIQAAQLEVRKTPDCGHNVHLENPQALADAISALWGND